jgi:hypothetical protein
MPSFWTRRRMLTAGAATAVTLPLVSSRAGAATLGGPVVTLGSPIRVFDSRQLVAPLNGSKLAAGDAVAVTVSGAFQAEQAVAVFANVTVTATEGAGFLTVVPEDLSGEQPLPDTSNINWSTPNVTRANLVLVQVGGENAIAVHCRGAGRTHLIVDIQGYIPFTA